MNRRALTLAFLAFALAAGVANASWYDDYDAGLAAVKRGNWTVVVQKMSSAIAAKSKEGNKERSYGVITVNYHPFYYRGVAYLNLGKYEEAVADFERTSGPGPENLGSIETLMDRAKKQLAAASEPDPAPAPAPRQDPPRATAPAVNPTPVNPAPATPQIDPSLRQRAASALATTKQKLQSAQQRRAGSSQQYTQAMSIYTDATTRNASARNNDDLQHVITMADNAGDLADLAMPPAIAAPAPAITPKPAAAATVIMADDTNEVRRALENYFAGEFEEAARGFQALTVKMPNNGWIWAFLGASQYSQYAFEADENYKNAALKSFARAKRLRRWSDGLPSKYFSKRIQKAFRETSS